MSTDIHNPALLFHQPINLTENVLVWINQESEKGALHCDTGMFSETACEDVKDTAMRRRRSYTNLRLPL